MMRFVTKLTIFMGLCLTLALPAYAFEVGVAPATRKILPETAMPESRAVTLEAARNEWEAFQIVVRHAAGALRGINAEVTDFAGPGGATIPKGALTFYREWYVNVTNESQGGMTYHERKKGLYPDPLVPFVDPYAPEKNVGAPFDLASQETGAIFADLFVPMNAVPGVYTATVTVSAEGQTPVTLPLTLTVWDYAIPLERTIATAFGYSYGAPPRFHGGPSGPDAAMTATLQKRYLEALHVHRIDPQEIPGDISFTFDASGALIPPDYTAFDAAAAPFMDGSYFADGAPVARYNIDRFRPGRGQGSMTVEQYKAAAKNFAEHLESKGWWSKAYVYSTDEPYINGGEETYNEIKADINILNEASPLWKNHALVTSYFVEKLREEIGIWCPVTQQYEKWFYGDKKPGRDIYEPLLAQGKELWFYVCNADFPPYAGYDIDTAIGYEPRMVKWGTYYEQATGFLYWRVTFWVNDDPWNELLDVEGFGDAAARNGDGFLIYPGNHDGTLAPKGSPADIAIDGPIVSYRMKQIRDGLEDWELFRMVEKEGGRDYVRAQVARAYSRFGDFFYEKCGFPDKNYYCPENQPWTLDENLLQEVRRNASAKLLYLLHPDTYPDPEAPVVDGDEDATDGDEDTADGDTSESAESETDPVDGDAESDATETAVETKSEKGCASGAAAPWALFALLPLLALRRRRTAC